MISILAAQAEINSSGTYSRKSNLIRKERARENRARARREERREKEKRRGEDEYHCNFKWRRRNASKTKSGAQSPVPGSNDDEEGEEHAVHSASHAILH